MIGLHNGGFSRRNRVLRTARLSQAVAHSLQPLESRLFFNLAPLAPTVIEPTHEGQSVAGSDVHMEIGDFSDPDAGDQRLNTDWEIWTTAATPARVWSALARVGPFDDHHIHLGDGTFEGALAGKTELTGNTDYQLRIKTRDNSGQANNTSPAATRVFHTLPTQLPTAAGWVAQQPGYKVEEIPFTFPAGEQEWRLPTNIAFVPDAIRGDHPEDPLFYVMELYGSIRVVTNNFTVRTYATGLLNYNPNGPISGSGENGSAGLVVDPTNGDVYATMLYDDLTDGTTDTYPKIVRYTSTDEGLTGTGVDILKMPLEPMRQSHFISNITFGPDDKLYVHIGDGFNATAAQLLQFFRGKIIRLNRDGSPVADNPFYNPVDRGGDGKPDSEDYVWSYAYRNPFGGAWRDSNQQHYVVENGPSRDRFSQLVRGRNMLFDGSDTSMNNYNIAYSATGGFENGGEDWNPATAPVNLTFVQQSNGNYSGFPVDKWDHAFVALSGPTHAAGPNYAKSIQEWVLNADGTRKVSAAGEPANPREIASYEGAGYATAAGIMAGPGGLYFTTLYPDANANPMATGAKIYRIVYTGTATPVDQYGFDEPSGNVATDFTGANNGILTNGPVRIAGTSGPGAIRFDGVDDHVALQQNIAPKLGGTATVVAWIRTTQTGSGLQFQAPGIIGVEQSGGDNDVFWGWIDGGGHIGLMAGNSDGAKSTNPINDGVWHQVALLRDAASGVVKVYVDGVLNSTRTSAVGFKSTPFASIGRIEDTYGSPVYFNGDLDDVRIYDRLLSDAEIAALTPGAANTAPTIAQSAAATPAIVTSTSALLTALGADDNGEGNLVYIWSVVGAPAGALAPVFSANNSNAAKSSTVTFGKAGSYVLRVTMRDVPGLMVTSDITITVNQTFTGITITPAGISIANGATQQFGATKVDQFGDPLVVQGSVVWSMGAGSIGTLSAAGLYTSPASGGGSATIIATSGAISKTTTATISSSGPDVLGGLLTRYPMDEGAGSVASDAAGANPGTLVNGPVWGAGKVGNAAITFDGINDYLQTAQNLAATLGGTATFTAWIKTTQVGSNLAFMAPGITGVEESGGSNDIFWGFLDASGRIGIQAGDVDGAKSFGAVNDGLWHHIALTRNVITGLTKVYVDGNLNGTRSSAPGFKSTPFASVGRIEDTYGTHDYFRGSLDEVRIYDRELSDAEVLTVKNAATASQPQVITFVSDLPFVTIRNARGPVERDLSNGELPANDGSKISIGGVKYNKGLGVHADSEVLLTLNGGYTRFQSDIGIDDEIRPYGSVVFQVFADDLLIYQSPVLNGSSAKVSIDLDVTGRNQLQLVVNDADDSNTADHADWANARLLSNAPVAVSGGSSDPSEAALRTTTVAATVATTGKTTVATTTVMPPVKTPAKKPAVKVALPVVKVTPPKVVKKVVKR